MKVLIATGLYPPEIGGPATYTTMLEEHLREHDIAVHVVPFGWVRRYPKLVRHAAYAWKVYRESKDVDCIYALDPVSVGVPALIANWFRKRPFYLRVAGDYAWEQGQQRWGVTETLDDFVHGNSHKPIFVRLLVRVERFVALRAKRVVVPSEYMKGIVAAWGVPEEQIVRIYSALFPLMVNATRDELRTQLEYDGLVITTAARLVPWKGMQRLIDALVVVRREVADASLVIVGDGPLRAELERHASEQGVVDAVRFVGRKTRESLGAVIKASDVFVLNTAYEGFSHQLLEVMDLGVPIVTTPVGGNVELIEDGVTGLLVPYNDAEELAHAIVRAGTHDTLRQNLTQHARAHVKHFTQERVTEELATLFKEERTE